MFKVELDLTNEIDLYILKEAEFKIEWAIQNYKYTIRDAESEIERSKDWECKDTFRYYSDMKKHAEESLVYNEKALARVKNLLGTVGFTVSK